MDITGEQFVEILKLFRFPNGFPKDKKERLKFLKISLDRIEQAILDFKREGQFNAMGIFVESKEVLKKQIKELEQQQSKEKD